MRKFIRKMAIIAGIATTVTIAGCGTTGGVETTTGTTESVKETTVTEEVTTTATTDTEEETTTAKEDTSEDTSSDISESISVDSSESIETVVSTEEKTSVNGDDETIYATKGDYINLNQFFQEAYEVGQIEISDNVVSVAGKSSVIAENTGTTVINCNLYDNTTNTVTKTSIKIVVR